MTMITKQVNFEEFWTWLQTSDGYKNNFSYEGAKALFEYLDEASDNGDLEQGQTDNYDAVAWCCEFTEYKDLNEVKENYNNIETLEDLRHNTIVVSEQPLIIADF